MFPASDRSEWKPGFTEDKSRFRFLHNAHPFTLFKRKASPYWYVQFEHRRKPQLVSLKTTDHRLAKTRAIARYDEVQSGAWTKPEPAAAAPAPKTTLGHILDRYEDAITLQNTEIEPGTIRANVLALERLVKFARPGLAEPRELPASALDEDLVMMFRIAYLEAAGTDFRRQESRRRGGNSVIRQARAVFSEPAMRLYRHLHLPDLTGFMKAAGFQAKRPLVLEVGFKVIEAITAASLALPPALFRAHLLYKHCAMRNVEVDAARWSWLRPGDAGAGWMHVDQTADFDPKGSLGRIPVPRDVMRILEAHRRGAGDPIVDAPTPSERHELVYRTHSAFMKPFLDDSSPKTSYRLRKWCADTIRMKYNDDASKAFLRHADKSLAAQHYWSGYNWPRLAALRNEDPAMIGITLADVGWPFPGPY